MDTTNEKLWEDMKRRWLRHLLLTMDAVVGYVSSAAGTLFVEFLIHHDKFMTPEGFKEHLFTALGSGIVGSGLYLRQKPVKAAPTPSGSSDAT